MARLPVGAIFEGYRLEQIAAVLAYGLLISYVLPRLVPTPSFQVSSGILPLGPSRNAADNYRQQATKPFANLPAGHATPAPFIASRRMILWPSITTFRRIPEKSFAVSLRH